jgi:RNA polymerase sigma factor (sigma-70 family)
VTTDHKIHQAVDHLFRHEAGKMVSVLSRMLGLDQLDTAQDIVQDTLLRAMSSWSFRGLPENPSAWLYRVARNRAIDHLRREKKFREISPFLGYPLQPETPGDIEWFADDEIRDSQLRMIFACCHPSIPTASQVALALKTLCGLDTGEIARAFLCGEETISKRIYRAREKMRSEKIALDLPPPAELPQRLDAVLHCLYLLFNEGYHSAHPDKLVREELCEEAIRLAYMLTLIPVTNLPRTRALLALFCFQASRLRARFDDRGQVLLLKYQDRSSWFKPLMDKGFRYLDSSIDGSQERSAYHLEAAIASLHASAKSFESTNWKSIYLLYGMLQELHPSPVVALNRAIAGYYAKGPHIAMEQLRKIEGLENYHLYHACLGEVHLGLGEKEEARTCFLKALSLTSSKQEQQLLESKIRHCDQENN